MKYKILINPKAKIDIQTAIQWYNNKSLGLGKIFHLFLKSQIEVLKSNPFFQVRYSNVRCLPLRKYPYMIHFTVDESKNEVRIRAVFNTSMDPKKWLKNK
ncbi:MAG: type II toxin-antitoxin system RelE/ParE family toxin [Saprospiraceae bacterium]